MLLSLVPLKGGLRFCLYFCSCDVLARAGYLYSPELYKISILYSNWAAFVRRRWPPPLRNSGDSLPARAVGVVACLASLAGDLAFFCLYFKRAFSGFVAPL